MKKTRHLQAGDPQDVTRAAEILRRGGLVAFATETVYGLGASVFSAQAVASIFEAKGRPAWDPLIVHLPSFAAVEEVAKLEGLLAGRVSALAEAFWPGPLTLLLPRTAAVPDAVTAGRPLVGVRVPAHPATQALLLAARVPLAAPSANRFGHISPTTAEHVLADLDGRIDAVLDAGPCTVGLESTVLDPQSQPMRIYRAGAITAEAIAGVCGSPAELYLSSGAAVGEPEALPSPGVGLRHYAPEVPLRLTHGSNDVLQSTVASLAENDGRAVGVLLPIDWNLSPKQNLLIAPWGTWGEPGSLTKGLFAGLRALESAGVDVIVCPLPEAGGIGDALRDRLLKAAKTR